MPELKSLCKTCKHPISSHDKTYGMGCLFNVKYEDDGCQCRDQENTNLPYLFEDKEFHPNGTRKIRSLIVTYVRYLITGG